MKHSRDFCIANSSKVLPIKTRSHLKRQHQNDAQYTLDIKEAAGKEPKIFTCLSVYKTASHIIHGQFLSQPK
jgi:hypothetical protein